LEYFKKAYQEFDHNNHDAAIELFTKSLKKNRKYYKTFNNRANVYLKVKRHEAALEDAEESLKLTPTANGYLIKGRALMGLERYEMRTFIFELSCLQLSLDVDTMKRLQHFSDVPTQAMQQSTTSAIRPCSLSDVEALCSGKAMHRLTL
jgi:tetratricopeptide (TPR) repeat protein